jgi:hypothetical protein
MDIRRANAKKSPAEARLEVRYAKARAGGFPPSILLDQCRMTAAMPRAALGALKGVGPYFLNAVTPF